MYNEHTILLNQDIIGQLPYLAILHEFPISVVLLRRRGENFQNHERIEERGRGFGVKTGFAAKRDHIRVAILRGRDTDANTLDERFAGTVSEGILEPNTDISRDSVVAWGLARHSTN